MATERFKLTWWPVLVHSLRTAVAAVVSLLVARLFKLPGTWWAPITTLVITQSSLGAALKVSSERFIGTALGALVGGLVASYLPPNVAVFGGCVFVLGLVCALAIAPIASAALRRRLCSCCPGRTPPGWPPFIASPRSP